MFFLFLFFLLKIHSIPIHSESNSIASLHSNVDAFDLDDFRGFMQVKDFKKRITFNIGAEQYTTTDTIIRNAQFVLFSGTHSGQKVFIKMFSNTLSYYEELGILRECNSDILLGNASLNFPILILKYTPGIAFTKLIHDFVIGKHLQTNPQDRALIDKLWPNFKEVSVEKFRTIYSIYKDKYQVKLGQKSLIHSELDPGKVIVTPDMEVVVIDFSNLQKIPRDEVEHRLLKFKAQDKLMGAFEKAREALQLEIEIKIREAAIPQEIEVNSDFDATVSQIDAVSQFDEDFPSYDHSITTIEEENLFDSFNSDDFNTRRRERVRQDSFGFWKNSRKIKSSKTARMRSLSDYAEVGRVSGEEEYRDAANTDATVVAGSNRQDISYPQNTGERSGDINGRWNMMLPDQKVDKYNSEGDEDGLLILEGEDDDFIDSRIPISAKDFFPSSSAHSDSFYSASSDLLNSINGEGSSRMRKPRSAGNLAKLVSEPRISNSMKKASAMTFRPVSPPFQLDMIRTLG